MSVHILTRRHMIKYASSFLFFVMMSSAGCKSVSTTQKLEEADFLGKWTYTADAAQKIARDFPKVTTATGILALNKDHTFTVNEVPNTWMQPVPGDSGDKVTALCSGNGTWSFGKSVNANVLLLHFTTIDGAERNTENMVSVLGNTVPYTLSFIIGDPDSCNEFQLQHQP